MNPYFFLCIFNLKGYALCRCNAVGSVPPFWRPDHFGTSGAPGGPWEQQDGHEGVQNQIFIDFELIVGFFFE